VEKKKQLEQARVAASIGYPYEPVQALKLEINELLDKECLMWQQRSRALFLKSGDSNTRFFHSRASHRYIRYHILGLKDNNNVWCTSDNQIAEIAVNFYKDLFTSSQPVDV